MRTSTLAGRLSLFLLCVLAARPAHGQVPYDVIKAFDAQFPSGAIPDAPLVPGSDGRFYGTTEVGGDYSLGTVFAVDTNGNLTTLHHFTGGADGYWPIGGLIQGSDGRFYGTTHGSYGTVFAMDADGTVTTLHTFSGADGNTPYGGVMQASDGRFYGTTENGGVANNGTLFVIDSAGTFNTIVNFNYSIGIDPSGRLIEGPDGRLYGTTVAGGNHSSGGYDDAMGTVFAITKAGTLTTLHTFHAVYVGTSYVDPEGALVRGGLTFGSDGRLYGSTEIAGPNLYGTFFALDLSGTLTILFNGRSDFYPSGHGPALVEGPDGRLYGTTWAIGGGGSVYAIDGSGALEVLHVFNPGDVGRSPDGGLTLGFDGLFYGVTQSGANSFGTIYAIDPTGSSFSTLYAFAASATPRSPDALIQGTDGRLYGAALEGGASSMGTIFAIDADATEHQIYDFTPADGGVPNNVIQGSDGRLYGTTSAGGYGGGPSFDMVFAIDTTGSLTQLHQFTSDEGDPSALIEAADGRLYGTACCGGDFGWGTVFAVDKSGTFTTVASFSDNEGYPVGFALLNGQEGRLYGTTCCDAVTGYGAVFALDTTGALTVVYRFPGDEHGFSPYGNLVQGADGRLYGVSPYDAIDGYGAVFAIDSTGAFTVVHDFSAADPLYPYRLIAASDGRLYVDGYDDVGNEMLLAVDTTGTVTKLHTLSGNDGSSISGLLQAADGRFYGTTYGGGAFGGGLIFRLTIPAPTATGGALTTLEDTPISGNASDSNPGGGPLTFTVTGHPTIGSVSMDPATGAFTYTPNPDANGADSFTFTVANAFGVSDPATIALTVTPVDDAPVAHDGTLTVTMNTPASGVLSATDVDSPSLTFAIVSNGAKGTAVLTNAATGAFTYSPNAGASGADVFTFAASDGLLTSAPASIAITIPVEPLTVTVASPNGGEKVFASVPTTIRWNGTGATAYSVEVARNGASARPTFTPVAGCTDLPATITSCVWTPGVPATTHALVRVTARGGSASVADVSDAFFTIAANAPALVLVAPKAATWAIGTAQTIAWHHDLGAGSSVRVDLSRDGGASWETLAIVPNSAPSTGGFTWIVSGPPASAVLVRVSSVDTPVQDTTDVPFAIALPSIVLTNPGTGAAWVIGTLRTISWTHNLGADEHVKLEVSHDGGATWNPFVPDVQNASATNGHVKWTADGPATSVAVMRVTWLRDASVQSAATFTLRSAPR
jgi:uncharacterized repeat protein (TIGR03803 family)